MVRRKNSAMNSRFMPDAPCPEKIRARPKPRPALASNALLYPNDPGHNVVSMTEVKVISRDARFTRAADQLTPLVGRAVINIDHGRRHLYRLPDAGEAVEMRVDGHQLIIIMLIRTGVCRRTIGVASVIHAGPKIGIVEVRVLVV